MGLFWIGFAICFLSPKACTTLGGPTAFDQVLETVQACDKARAALGGDIGAAWVGMTSGKSRSGGGSGLASWSTSVEGTKAKGPLSWSARKTNGVWEITRASLTVNGTAIDVLECAKSKSKKDDE